jgi:hypothetical protein
MGGGDGTDNQTKAGECGVVGHEPLESWQGYLGDFDRSV